MEANRIRAVVVQSATTLFDLRGAVTLVRQWAAKAATQGAQLVVFPGARVGAVLPGRPAAAASA